MEIVKITKDYTVLKKKNGRFGVRRPNRSWVNGNEKVEILLKEGLITTPPPKTEAASEEQAVETSGPGDAHSAKDDENSE